METLKELIHIQKSRLYHHGIPNQKWGVRNGPPYPLSQSAKSSAEKKAENSLDKGSEKSYNNSTDPTIMTKGTKLNSVSSYVDSEVYKKRGRWLYAYDPNDKWDSAVYKGPFSKYLRQCGARKVYEHQYETVKDLKMPTKQQRVDAFIDMYKDSPITVADDLSYIQKLMKRANMGSAESRNVKVSDLKSEQDFRAAYEIFNHAMEAAYRFVSTRKYAELMSKKYDAMIDDNNQSVYNETNKPVIIFKANEALKTIGSVNLVDDRMINNNFNEVLLKLSRKGKRVAL